MKPPLRPSHRSCPATAPSALLACALLSGAPPAGAAPDAPAAFRAVYAGSQRVGPFTARAQVHARLQREGPYALYTLHTTVSLPLVQRRFHGCSLMRREGGGWRPLVHVHRDFGNPANDVRTRFDWAQGRAHTVLGPPDAASSSVPLSGPTWDPLSFQVALMGSAAAGAGAGAAAEAGQTHRVVERGRLRVHRVQLVGEPAGDAGSAGMVEVHSRKDGAEQPDVALLLDPAAGYRPARITVDGVTLRVVDGEGAGRDAGADATAGEVDAACALPR